MEQKTQEAKKGLSQAWRENYDPEIFGVPEACDELNNASRKLVYAMVADSAGGEVWLGRINRYRPEERLMWPYRGPVLLHPSTAMARDMECDREYIVRSVGIVYNFGAAFVVPCFDEALHMALIDWQHSPKSAAWDLIAERVNTLGGHFLHWS